MNSYDTNMKSEVYINIYDLNNINICLWDFGLGIYHSGIEIDEYEYSFGGIRGIYITKPKSLIPLRQRLLLGTTNKSINEINKIIKDLKHDFYPERYHPTNNNCNHFTNTLSLIILNKKVPNYINRLPYFCSCLSCIIAKNIDLDYKEKNINFGSDIETPKEIFMENRADISDEISAHYDSPPDEIIIENRKDSFDEVLHDYEIV
jgi:deubiquitinase DESI2